MDAVDFLEEFKQLIPDYKFEDSFEYIDEERNFKINIMRRREDLSLYCDIEYNNVLYYYNFNNTFDDFLYDGYKGKSVKLEVLKDLIEKIDALVNDKEFDSRITIELDLEEDVLNLIYKNAHEMDITVNQYIEYLLREYLKIVDKEII